MREVLINRLWEYIRDNNPDILLALEAEGKLQYWLNAKAESVGQLSTQMRNQRQPDYIIEQVCIAELTKDLRPSRYNYIINILEHEFPVQYAELMKAGLLQHEVINMVGYCYSVFEDLRFSEETEENMFINYAITGTIAEYLESNSGRETVSNELQQSAET